MRHTELFDTSDNDLAFSTLTFTPDGSANFYAACREAATSFPTDPAGGYVVPLGDDDYVEILIEKIKVVIIRRRPERVVPLKDA